MIDCVVIGLGRIGFQLSKDPYREKPCTHSEGILMNPQTRLRAGIDIDASKRSAFTRALGCPAYPSWEEYLSHHPLPGIVFIATPPSTHGYYLNIARRQGLPVVVVEKPIAADYREALSLNRSFRKSPTRVVVNHERRFANDYRHVKKIIREKKYGKLLSLHGYIFTGFHSNRVSLLHDGTHLLDIATFLTQAAGDAPSKHPIKKFQALSSSRSGNSLNFSSHINNIPCHFEIGGKKKYFHFEINLYFEHGKIDIGNGFYREWASAPSRLYKGFVSLKLQNKQFPKTHYFKNMVEHAVKLYRDPSMNSESSIEDALIIFKVIELLKL